MATRTEEGGVCSDGRVDDRPAVQSALDVLPVASLASTMLCVSHLCDRSISIERDLRHLPIAFVIAKTETALTEVVIVVVPVLKNCPARDWDHPTICLIRILIRAVHSGGSSRVIAVLDYMISWHRRAASGIDIRQVCQTQVGSSV